MATKEDRNFMIVRLALDKPCTNLLQEVLRQHVPEKDINKLLNDPTKKRKIFPLLQKLNQETTLYPPTGVFSGSYAAFDLSLLYVLIRNLTRIHDHNAGWGNIPLFMITLQQLTSNESDYSETNMRTVLQAILLTKN